jgi:hypothetical protein
MRRKLIATVAAVALGVSVPAASAIQGGIPASTKPCPGKAQGNGPKKGAPNTKGKKCGFNRTATNGVTTVTP